MNIDTGRQFLYQNPQDDPALYPAPPPGFRYRSDGSLVAEPHAVQAPSKSPSPNAPAPRNAKEDPATVSPPTPESYQVPVSDAKARRIGPIRTEEQWMATYSWIRLLQDRFGYRIELTGLALGARNSLCFSLKHATLPIWDVDLSIKVGAEEDH